MDVVIRLWNGSREFSYSMQELWTKAQSAGELADKEVDEGFVKLGKWHSSLCVFCGSLQRSNRNDIFLYVSFEWRLIVFKVSVPSKANAIRLGCGFICSELCIMLVV